MEDPSEARALGYDMEPKPKRAHHSFGHSPKINQSASFSELDRPNLDTFSQQTPNAGYDKPKVLGSRKDVRPLQEEEDHKGNWGAPKVSSNKLPSAFGSVRQKRPGKGK